MHPSIHRLLAILALVTGCCLHGADRVLGEQGIADATTIARAIAADPVIIAAVTGYNIAPGPELRAMTNDRWNNLTRIDPLVRAFTTNDAAEVIRKHRSPAISEAFLSGADGGKVAFLSKPSSWSHAGSAKHEIPMKGKVWRGNPAFDESTGKIEIQFAVPVMKGGRPVGSLVIGVLVDPPTE